jgi:DNA polymerase elongation subunit (family B)
MFTNAHYDTRQSRLHLWESIKGERFYDCIDFSPFVFLKHYEDEDVKTIDGVSVGRKSFSNYAQYKSFIDKNKQCYENEVNPVIQFLSERYSGISDDDMEVPHLVIHFEDIEVHSADEFPKPDEAKWPITIITIAHNRGIQSFGLHPFVNDKGIENLTYHHCKDEYDLLTQYFNWKHTNMCDVVTGWFYCDDRKAKVRGGFDLPYIINRTKVLFGDDTKLYKKLSPINNVNSYVDRVGVQHINIAGVTLLDYMSVYRWYTTNNLESNKLDHVAEVENLGGKIDYGEYGTLQELYMKNWQLYCEYNINDALLIQNIEKKCGYLSLIQSLTLLCRVPMDMYNTTVGLVEGLMLVYYRRNNLAAPRLMGGDKEWFPAAFVKEPYKGLHPWVVDLDITSSYPSHIIILNISNETYYGRIIGFNENHVVDYNAGIGIHNKDDETRPFYDIVVDHARNKKFPPFYLLKDGMVQYIDGQKLDIFNKSIEKKLLSIAPCGSMFKNGKRGVIPTIEKMVFIKRKEEKNKMSLLYEKSLSIKDGKSKKKILDKAKQKYDLQWAFKILINSIYGIMAVPYSRYFNINMAEAITSCGRHTILDGQRYANKLLNNPNEELLNIINEIKIYDK